MRGWRDCRIARTNVLPPHSKCNEEAECNEGTDYSDYSRRMADVTRGHDDTNRRERRAMAGGRKTLRNAQRLRIFLPTLPAEAVVATLGGQSLCGVGSAQVISPLKSCGCCAARHGQGAGSREQRFHTEKRARPNASLAAALSFWRTAFLAGPTSQKTPYFHWFLPAKKTGTRQDRDRKHSPITARETPITARVSRPRFSGRPRLKPNRERLAGVQGRQ